MSTKLYTLQNLFFNNKPLGPAFIESQQYLFILVRGHGIFHVNPPVQSVNLFSLQIGLKTNRLLKRVTYNNDRWAPL